MLTLPPRDSEIRTMFDMGHLAEIANPKNRAHMMPTLRDALNSASRMFEDKAVKSINSICMTADGHIRLVRIGRRLGIKRLWDFTPAL